MHKPRRARLAVPAIAAVLAAVLLPSARAAGPDQFGPFEDTYDFTVDCGSFDATIAGVSRTWVTVWGDGTTVDRLLMRVLAPADTLTNTTTGRSVVVRGEFSETAERIGDDEWRVTVRGHRYMVNEPGKGLVIADVGRIVYGNLEEDDVLSAAGRHELAQPAEVEPRICELVA
jgi:hypothetical protein